MGSFGGEGRLIVGRYRLGERLGRGGMGTVWRATDELLGRQVAVKELNLDEDLPEAETQVQRERTMREARTVAAIKHPNVIVLHDVVEQDGRPWIVMECVDGESLADRLSGGGPVAPREAARIALALLGALRVAHARGVLHRDIKPANVLLEEGTSRVVLTDFGIAQMPGTTTLTETGVFVGSPEYTAPERMAGQGTGPEADLWSVGVLLCAALSGESPFRRDSLGGVLHAVLYDEIELPESARPLLAVVRGLMERDPARRLDVPETERLLRGYLQSGRAPELAAKFSSTRDRLPQQPVPEAGGAAGGGPFPAGPVSAGPSPAGRTPEVRTPGTGLPVSGVPGAGAAGAGAGAGVPGTGVPGAGGAGAAGVDASGTGVPDSAALGPAAPVSPAPPVTPAYPASSATPPPQEPPPPQEHPTPTWPRPPAPAVASPSAVPPPSARPTPAPQASRTPARPAPGYAGSAAGAPAAVRPACRYRTRWTTARWPPRSGRTPAAPAPPCSRA
ncbi:serine/threonine-protein kinase [Streptomyces sp. MST-110588]|uniref:serine/threonine-protein kinase n=1 Tax=Streptomyces sp. MST-110588 TaxID=2833628 RepID=UPI001F5C96AB|nr:serine/threonine-protein kinase [Streptomyces sp. MST-110588]UNO40351.1 serine/threonine protein kinase [Streptomyces sp. MST-110588]